MDSRPHRVRLLTGYNQFEDLRLF